MTPASFPAVPCSIFLSTLRAVAIAESLKTSTKALSSFSDAILDRLLSTIETADVPD